MTMECEGKDPLHALR